MIIAFFTSLFVLLGDQLLKNWVTNNFKVFDSHPAVPGLFDWFYIQNDGAGWGMLSGRLGLFVLITIPVLIYLFYLIHKNRQREWYVHITYGLLLGGTLGNLVDRLRLGYVIDMFRLTFIDFPIFNLADSSLTIGVISLILILFFADNSEELL